MQYQQLSNTGKLFLSGVVSFSKNVDVDEYKYFGYEIGFDRKGEFSCRNGFGRNLSAFGVDMSSSVHVDNKRKDILILGEGPTQGYMVPH